MLEIRLLGQYNLQQDKTPVDIPSRPAKKLLAYLLITRGTEHPRERLAGLLWPDSSDSNARKNLRQALWNLRKSIGDSYLRADQDTISFNTSSDHWLDIALLEDGVESDLEAQLSTYQGELLPGYYDDWVLLERDRLDAVYERKILRLLTQLTRDQRWSELLKWAEHWIAQGQVPEPAYRALMIAHAAQGDLSKVKDSYARCVEALRQDIDVDPSEETTDLYERLMSGEKITGSMFSMEPAESPSTAPRPIRLPAQPTPFIGRKEELTEIFELLDTSRLLTLTGPGGIGKTRLAIHSASIMGTGFKDGCYFVSLAPIRTEEQLVQRIAEGLDFPLVTQEDPEDRLLHYLKERQLLLVMDNFEHLLDGANLVSKIIQFAPKVKILATSREKLNLQSETVLAVRGMSLPDNGPPVSFESDAVHLFLQRAQKVQPGFDPSPVERRQIVDICKIAQGMPLAIELAAAWLYVIDIEEIVEELDKGLDFLAADLRDAPERHRSIRAVFDHTWSLLEKDEQDIFMRLSIFRGGFTREAGQQVTRASLPQIAGLVNKSLLSHDPGTGRFEVHELLRQYAQEQLEKQLDASVAAQEAHAAFYAEFMEQSWEDLKCELQIPALQGIEADIENVRAAWQYSLAQRDTAQLWKFIYGLWNVYWIRWWTYAGMELFSEAVGVLEGDLDEQTTALRALSMAFQSYFMAWSDLVEEGLELARESVETLHPLEHPEALVFAYDAQLINAYFLGRYSEFSQGCKKMLEITSELDDPWLSGFVQYAASMDALREKDYAEAERYAITNLNIIEGIGDVFGSILPLIALGHVALARGNLEGAKEYYLRCLMVSEEIGHYFGVQTNSKYLGKLALTMGDLTKAEGYLVQSLILTKEIGFVRDIVNLMFEFARLKVAEGQPEEAVELLALVIQHPSSLSPRIFEGPIRESAKELLAQIDDELPPETIAVAVERGRAMDLDEVVGELLHFQ